MLRVRLLLRRLCSVGDAELSKLQSVVGFTSMHSNIYKKLGEFHREYERINDLLTQPDSADAEELREVRSKIDLLSLRNSHFQAFSELIEEAKFLVEAQADPKLRELVEEEKQVLEDRLVELTDEAIAHLLEKDKYDDCSVAVVELKPGVGGAESMLFAEEMFSALKSYSQNRGWR